MNFSTFFRPALLLAALPAMLTFSACKDDDKPTPQQGRVLLVHAAPTAAVPVKILAGTDELGQLNYGAASSSYVTLNAGTANIKVNAASSGQTAVAKDVTIAANTNYSLFAFSPTTAASNVDVLQVTDDLTAPVTDFARVRIVHLALNAPSPVKLSQSTVAGATDVPGVTADFGAPSAFASIPKGNYNLLVTTGATSLTVVSVGDGTGSGTGTRNYESGKIYTIVVRGIANSLDSNLAPKATVIQNN